ncbi:MAG: HI0074 family nucleotidyltransferase substrate-binding subunit, partial [Gammaproteobacteria bacterium]
MAVAEWASALDRLDEALALPADAPLLIDGTMQRFEFCFELAWKSLKLMLSEQEGIAIASPRQALEQAFALGWILPEEPWLQMLQDRNLSSHTYRQGLAREIHARIPLHAQSMRML